MGKYQPNTVFTVAFQLPPGATVAMAREYIKNVLLSECGTLRPEDPMFGFGESLIVTHRPPMVP